MICQYKQCKRGLLSFRVAKVLILYGTAKLICKKSPPQKIESLRLASDQRLPIFRQTLTQVQLSCFYIYIFSSFANIFIFSLRFSLSSSCFPCVSFFSSDSNRENRKNGFTVYYICTRKLAEARMAVKLMR